jgi:hypothetical protein
MALRLFKHRDNFTLIQFHNVSLTIIPSLKFQLLYIVTLARKATTFRAKNGYLRWLQVKCMRMIMPSDPRYVIGYGLKSLVGYRENFLAFLQLITLFVTGTILC